MTEVNAESIKREFNISSPSINFSDVKIIDKLKIYINDSSNYSVVFHNCIFVEEFILTGPVYHNLNISFRNVVFKKSLTLTVRNSGSISFNQCTNEGGFIINGNSLPSLNIENSNLIGKVELKGSFSTVKCINSIYQTPVPDDSFNFNNVRVNGNADFTGSKLVNASFKNSIFGGNAKFVNTSFLVSSPESLTDFSDAYFTGEVSFDLAAFERKVAFTNVTFKEVVRFSNVNINSACIADFSNANFNNVSIFDKSKWLSILFAHSKFFELVFFKDASIHKLILTKALFIKGADFLNANIELGDRETFRIIKNEFLKINNNVDALHFKSKEMIAYEQELRSKGEMGELFLVFMNKVSNKHGLSWSRGLLFTLITAILFYCVYLITLESPPYRWGWKGWESYTEATDITIRYFIKFLIITHDIEFMAIYKPTAGSFIIDFVGKIFIGYGIYQTIQAFRKHGKL